MAAVSGELLSWALCNYSGVKYLPWRYVPLMTSRTYDGVTYLGWRYIPVMRYVPGMAWRYMPTMASRTCDGGCKRRAAEFGVEEAHVEDDLVVQVLEAVRAVEVEGQLAQLPQVVADNLPLLIREEQWLLRNLNMETGSISEV